MRGLFVLESFVRGLFVRGLFLLELFVLESFVLELFEVTTSLNREDFSGRDLFTRGGKLCV